MSTRRLAYLAIWIALTVALGYLLAGIPNVELVTASIFLGGLLTGPLLGIVLGALAEFTYSLISPYGLAAPPLLVAQLIGMALVGFTGGLIGAGWFQTRSVFTRHALCGVVGFGLTLFFDFITTASFLVFSGVSLKKLAVSFFFGIGFYLVHLIWNTLAFATVVPILARKLPSLLATVK